MNVDASAKMARIHFAKKRHERHISSSSTASYQPSPNTMQPGRYDAPLTPVPPPANFAVELPAEDVMPLQPRPLLQYNQHPSVADMKYTVISPDEGNYPQSPASAHSHHHHQQYSQRASVDSPRTSSASLRSHPSIDHYSGSGSDYRPDSGHRTSPPNASQPGSAPPLPPKTPLPYPGDGGAGDDSMRRWQMGGLRNTLPYPDDSEPPPPPPVNVARKPEFGVSR